MTIEAAPLAASSFIAANLDLIKAAVLGRLEREGRGSNVLAGPFDALAWLVNELSGLGLTLKAGEVVTTGTLTIPLPIGRGDTVEVEFGALGRVSVRIA